MDKQRVCVIGAGGCGNKLLDVLMDIDKRYTPVYCNTNLREMENLKYFDAGNNVLYFANAGGTGRDRNKAKEAIKKEQAKTIDFLASRFSETSGIDTFFLVGSSDGGTGSGSIPILAKAIRLINPDARVNILGAMSKFGEKEASLKNTKGFWNDIIKLMKDDVINSVQFIDNNKMADADSFNYAVMKEFDDSLSINNEEIDVIDSRNTNTAKGYKVTLKLDPQYTDIKMAIKQAEIRSNFILPNPDSDTNKIKCGYFMATFNKNSRFNVSECKTPFDITILDKVDTNEESMNMIVLGGTNMPKDYINIISSELKNLQAKNNEQELALDDLLVEDEVKNNTPIKKDNQRKKKSLNRERLNDLMQNTDLWD